MHHLDFIILSALTLAWGLFSKAADRSPLTLPILSVALGIAIGPVGLGVSHLDVEVESVRLLAEFTLALVLFYDASRIDLRRLRSHLGLPARLLGPGLIATVLLGFAIGVPLLGGAAGGGLGLWEIALVAALLAPTDAALGQAVVTQESVPLDERMALNVESGLNDGLIVPVVAALMACSIGAASADASTATWLLHAGRVLAYGIGPGLVIGWVAAMALNQSKKRDWMHPGSAPLAVVAIPVLAFFAAELMGGSGFLAAFVAGLTVGGTAKAIDRATYSFTEDAGEILGLVTWTVFGVAAAPAAIHCATWPVITYAVLSLTVIRMLPVALAMAGAGFRMPTKLFIGWFGPRGLASVVFAVGVLAEEGIPGRDQIFGVAVWTVLLSVILHGMTAGWLARRYGASATARA